jgi:DNA repair photolyase
MRVGTRVSNPPNPWSEREVEYLDENPAAQLEVFEEQARSILSRNDPAAVGFEFGLNPYRGCQHACAYCEARRRHELLGFGAGTDFDSKIVVKPNAPELLRRAFESKAWRGDVVVFSGATDCYQPFEASYRLTRRCLEVCAEYRNPVAIITKGALIERDLDVLIQLRDSARVTASVSIPLWNVEVARALEPLVPTPARRMRTIRRLAEAGLDVGISVAPFILGLSEDGFGELLHAAKDAGAARATLSFLRLPTPVEAVFAERIRHVLPDRAKVILARVKAPHAYATLAASLYESTCRRLGLPFSPPGDDRANTPDAGPHATRTFQRPPRPGKQLRLFDT